MPYQTRMPAALAARGLRVEVLPGWETRGSPSLNPRGVVCHWTAGPRGTTARPSLGVVVHGRPGLPGPLAQIYLDRSGVPVVVAAGRANHAGRGGWRGLSGNSSVFGIEAESAGEGDWTPAQQEAYPKVVAALLDLTGHDEGFACGHSEWAPTRKVDIGNWDMHAMRGQVAAILGNHAPAAPTPEEDDDMLILARQKDHPEVYIGDGVTRRHVTTQAELDDIKWLMGQKILRGDPEIRVVERIDWLGKVV